MQYSDRLTPKALESIESEAKWWAENHSESQAEKFLEGFLEALKSLGEMPGRCGFARESILFDFDLHEFHFGTGKHATHRALFRIEKARVVVLQVRRHSQSDVTAADLE